MNAEQQAIAEAVDRALATNPIPARRLGSDARQIAWLAALEAPEDAQLAASRAIRREARKLGGTVSLDAVRPNGDTLADHLAAPEPVETVEANVVDRLLATQLDGTRELVRQTVLDGVAPEDAGQFEWHLRAHVRQAAARGTKPAERAGLQLTALLQGLGAHRLPVDLRAPLAAMVMLAERHSTEFGRLVEMNNRAGAGRAVGMRHPDRLVLIACQANGTTPAVAFGSKGRPTRPVIATRMMAAGLLWLFTELARPDIEQMLRIGRGHLGRYLGSDPVPTLPTLQQRIERDEHFAAGWRWACRQVGTSAVRPMMKPPEARHCESCGGRLHWRTTLPVCAKCRDRKVIGRAA